MTIQEQIKALLKTKGMTQKALCQKANLCEKSLSYFLREKHQFNLSTLQIVAAALDCDIVLMPKERGKNK